jgi:DNA-directed RNA polymerase specialized sigma24 family protein
MSVPEADFGSRTGETRRRRGGRVSVLDDIRRYRIDRALEEACTSLRPQVVSTVARRVSKIPRDEVEAAYNQACLAYWRALAEGEEIQNPVGWLVGTTFHKAVSEGRKLHFDRRTDKDVGRLRDQNGASAGIDEEISAATLQRRLGELFSEQELQILELHCLGTMTREEVAERVGLSARQVKRAVLGKTEGERIARQGIKHKVAQLVHEVIDGEPCEDRREQVAAYARGLVLSDAERADAQDHIGGCQACAGFARGVRGLVAVLPPGGAAATVAAGGAAAGGAGSVAGGAAVGGGAAAAGVASGGSLLGGTIAKLCAGTAVVCAAAGAGVATDVTPLPDRNDNKERSAIVQPSKPVKDETSNVEAISEGVAAPSPAPQQPVPSPQPAPPPLPPAAPAPPAPPPEPPPPPPEQEQFDPAAAAAAEPAPQPSSPTPQQPAPAPDTGVGEFLGGP